MRNETVSGSTNRSPAAFASIWVVVATAFVGALGESAARYSTQVFLHRPTFLNPESVWLGPLLNLAVLAIPAALIYAVSAPPKRQPRLVFLGLVFVCMEVLLLARTVSVWASLILALGVAAEGTRRLTRDAAGTARFAQRLAVVLIATSIALSAAHAWTTYRTEHNALGQLPPADSTSPNVVLVVLDAVRAQSMGLYGGPPATTPFLSRLASRCVTYRNAIATAPWTLPSHASLLTGRWPRDLSADWAVPMDGRSPTVAERMGAVGYATIGSVGNYLYTYHEFGLARGFAHYADYGVSPGEAGIRSVVGDRVARAWNVLAKDHVVLGRKDAARVTRDMFNWVDESARGRPYFAFMNWYDAHDPYNPPGRWRNLFARTEPPTRAIDSAESPHDSATVDGLRRAYLGAVGYMDSQLDSLVRELQQRGTLDRTLLVITADHGEEFAEHGRLQHGYTLYYTAVHVPLMICPPGGDSLGGRTVTKTVSLRDVAATMLAVAKSGSSPADTLPGYDLLALADSAVADSVKPCRSPAISFVRRPPGETAWYKGSTRELSSIVDERYHLIRTDEGREELYDVVADPLEQQDLLGSEGTDSVAARLRLEMERPEACLR